MAFFSRLLSVVAALFALSACIKIADETAFQQVIIEDSRLVGEWHAVKWFSPDAYSDETPDLRIEARQHNGKTVYAIVSDDPKYTSDIKDFMTVYKFGGHTFGLTGYPQDCSKCVLLKYVVTDDTISVLVLDQDEAIKYLEVHHPDKSRIFYGVQGSVSDVRIDRLDDQTQALLADMAAQDTLWKDGALLKKHK